MGKIKIGSMKHLTLVEGDVNLIAKNEILVSEDEGYTLLRKRLDSGSIKTFVVIPLEDFIKKDGDNNRKKVEET